MRTLGVLNKPVTEQDIIHVLAQGAALSQAATDEVEARQRGERPVPPDDPRLLAIEAETHQRTLRLTLDYQRAIAETLRRHLAKLAALDERSGRVAERTARNPVTGA